MQPDDDRQQGGGPSQAKELEVRMEANPPPAHGSEQERPKPAATTVSDIGMYDPHAFPALGRGERREPLVTNPRLPSSTGTTWTAPGAPSFSERLRNEGLEGRLSPQSPFARPGGMTRLGPTPGASPLPAMASNQAYGPRVTLDSPTLEEVQHGWTPLRVRNAASELGRPGQPQRIQPPVPYPTPMEPYDGDLFDPAPTGQLAIGRPHPVTSGPTVPEGWAPNSQDGLQAPRPSPMGSYGPPGRAPTPTSHDPTSYGPTATEPYDGDLFDPAKATAH